ncbi:MAG: hypothetical protein ABH840_02000 [Nanoarchaeota archaeon]
MKKGLLICMIIAIVVLVIIGIVSYFVLNGNSDETGFGAEIDSIGNFVKKDRLTITCEKSEEDKVDGYEDVYTNSEDGNKYSVSILPLVGGEVTCSAGATNYYDHPILKKSCKDHVYKYNDLELVATREGPGIYFFWVSNDNSVKVFDEEGWTLPGTTFFRNSEETLNEINESFIRTKPLIDYYLGEYPSVKECQEFAYP